MNESKSTRFSFLFPEEINDPLIKAKFSSVVAELFLFTKDIDQKMQVLQDKIELWRENNQKQIIQQYNHREDVITLDVRGQKFTTPKAALVNRFGSYLHALVCSPHSFPASNGAFFIDCSPECFDRILDFHATGRLNLTGLNKAQRDILSHSLKHLCIEDVFAGSIMHPPHSGSFDIENLINSTANSSTTMSTVFSDRMHVTTNNLTRYKSNISLELQSLVDMAKEVDLKLQGVEEVEKLWIRSEEAVLLAQINLPELVTFKIQDSDFKTFRSSLQGTEKVGSYFHAMLKWNDSKGGSTDDNVFTISDRSADGFERILEYLCSGRLILDGLSEETTCTLEENIDYFAIPRSVLDFPRKVFWHCPSDSLVNNVRVDPNCITIRKVKGGCGWNAAVRGVASTDRYTVRVDELGLHKVAMIGFISEEQMFDEAGCNHRNGGWFFGVHDGKLYHCDRRAAEYITTALTGGGQCYSSALSVKNTLTVCYNRLSGEIHFEKYSTNLGVAFKQVGCQKLYPVIEMWEENSCFTVL